MRVRWFQAAALVTAATATAAAIFACGFEGAGLLSDVKMPFATGRTCDDQAPASVTAKADLTGTKFQIAANQFISEGFNVSAAATTTGRATALSMTAFPGGMHSCRPGGTDYYQRNGGKCLQLEYAP